jgi:hypothetical protein
MLCQNLKKPLYVNLIQFQPYDLLLILRDEVPPKCYFSGFQSRAIQSLLRSK